MNGKQAKRLRRAALGLAATLEQAGKKIEKDGYDVMIHNEREFNASSVVADVKGAEPEEKKAPVMPIYTIFVRPDSYKGIYKKLKSGKVA